MRLRNKPEWIWIVVGLCTLGCQHFMPSADRSASFGGLYDGMVIGGTALRDRGDGWVRARPGERSNVGVARLVNSITAAAEQVELRFPGSLPLRIGDVSYPHGGAHPRHHSHRSGRDVDIVFYATDTRGQPAQGSGWLAFDRHGVAIDQRNNEVRLFDTARNWAFVEELLRNQEIELRWIFCSNGVKSQLLAYANHIGVEASIVRRARWILHQPSTGNPHNDHFHVRIACTLEERASGCYDNGPYWPWSRWNDKVSTPASRDDDATLVADLTSEPTSQVLDDSRATDGD